MMIPWGVRGLRADKLTLDLVKKMHKAGCSHVAIGIESANPEMLKRMGKNETIEQIQHGIQMLRSVHIDVVGQFMIGNPGETLSTVKESIRFVKQNDIRAVFSTAVPFPGTQLWDYIQNHGRFLIEPDCTLFERIEPRIIFETPEFSKAEVLEAIRLVEEAGVRVWKQAGVSLRDKSIKQIWFKYIYGILPKVVSYNVYFLLRRIKAFIRRHRMNCLWIRGDGVSLLFDSSQDPEEKRDLAKINPEKVQELKGHLPRAEVKGETLKIDRDIKEQLRDLGYM